MSPSVVAYLGSMLLMFFSQRVLGGTEGWSTALAVIALVGLGIAVWFRFAAYRQTTEPGLRLGHRGALIALGVGVGSMLIYGLASETVVRGLGLGEEAEQRWVVTFSALWPIAWLLGTVPLLAVDRAIRTSPVIAPEARVRAALDQGVVAALAISLIFPVNYLASQFNEEWDLAYFKTTEPGSATRAMVDALPEPVDVRIYLPPATQVESHLVSYFSNLEGPNLRVRVLDRAEEPRMARAMKVRHNGTVAFVMGELDLDPKVGNRAEEEGEGADDAPKGTYQTIRIGTNLEKAKSKLKKLDEEVQKALSELARGEQIAYLTAGHDEAAWEGSGPPDRRLIGFKKILEMVGFTVRSLSVADGLSRDVPEDAGLVVVMGPQTPFGPAEVESLRRYVDRGGALLLALDPDVSKEGGPLGTSDREDPLDDLVKYLGITRGEGVLASLSGIVPRTRTKQDRMNVVTNRFSSHAATTVLSQASNTLVLMTPTAGRLELESDSEHEVTVLVRSIAAAWADVDGDLEFDLKKEQKATHPIAAATEGKTDEGQFRAVVVADSTAFTDLTMLINRGNQQFAHDIVAWLVGREGLAGTTENEEDVKIEHTKEGQAGWFYATVLGVPLLVLGVGFLRLSRRRKWKGTR